MVMASLTIDWGNVVEWSLTGFITATASSLTLFRDKMAIWHKENNDRKKKKKRRKQLQDERWQWLQEHKNHSWKYGMWEKGKPAQVIFTNPISRDGKLLCRGYFDGKTDDCLVATYLNYNMTTLPRNQSEETESENFPNSIYQTNTVRVIFEIELEGNYLVPKIFWRCSGEYLQVELDYEDRFIGRLLSMYDGDGKIRLQLEGLGIKRSPKQESRHKLIMSSDAQHPGDQVD